MARSGNRRLWWTAAVLGCAAVGCAGSPRAERDAGDERAKTIRVTWERCDPGAVELMDKLLGVKPGMDAVAIFRTAGHASQGVIATEGDVEMILQEALGGLPEGTELAGKGVFGKLPAGPEWAGRGWWGKTRPEEQQRFFVRVMAVRPPESKAVLPVCMMLTMDGLWGTPVAKHESGALIMKEMARVRAVPAFDESKPPAK